MCANIGMLLSSFDTSAGALVLSNQFLELTTKLPSFKIFGLGQNALKQHHHEFNWSTFSMFSSKSKVQYIFCLFRYTILNCSNVFCSLPWQYFLKSRKPH